jgi:hypothetical protein
MQESNAWKECYVYDCHCPGKYEVGLVIETKDPEVAWDMSTSKILRDGEIFINVDRKRTALRAFVEWFIPLPSQRSKATVELTVCGLVTCGRHLSATATAYLLFGSDVGKEILSGGAHEHYSLTTADWDLKEMIDWYSLDQGNETDISLNCYSTDVLTADVKIKFYDGERNREA